jgi:hypothetical protein
MAEDDHAAVVSSLGGKAVSRSLALQSQTLVNLRNVHGQAPEDGWRQVLCFDFE